MTNVANSAGGCGEEKKCRGEEKSSSEKRKNGAEKRKSGAEKRRSGGQKRNCTLGPPYSLSPLGWACQKERTTFFSTPLVLYG